MPLNKLYSFLSSLFKSVTASHARFYNALHPPLIYTELAPASPNEDFDFSRPPHRTRDPFVEIRNHYEDHYWRGEVPDDSFESLGIYKDNLIVFEPVPITGYSPEPGKLVLVPPLGEESINTPWGQLAIVIENNDSKLLVASSADEHAIQREISATQLLAKPIDVEVRKFQIAGISVNRDFFGPKGTS